MDRAIETSLKTLEAIISAGPNDEYRKRLVRRQLAEMDIYALGHSAGPESEVLHISVERGGEHREVTPVFTRPALAIETQSSNPEWDSLSILLIRGRDLLKAEDPTGTILIDPFSELEFELSVT